MLPEEPDRYNVEVMTKHIERLTVILVDGLQAAGCENNVVEWGNTDTEANFSPNPRGEPTLTGRLERDRAAVVERFFVTASDAST